MELKIMSSVSKNGFMDVCGVTVSKKDLQHVRRKLRGRVAICRRTTHQEAMVLRKGEPFDCKETIVVTSSDYQAAGCRTARTLSQALELASGEREAIILGGPRLIAEALSLPETSTIYLTELGLEYDGKIRFPEIDRSYWKETKGELHAGDFENPPVAFKTFKNSCPLCPQHRWKFFRNPLKEEELFDFILHRGKIMACYKRGHAERFEEIDQKKAQEELNGFSAWLKSEYRKEELTSYRFPDLN